MKPNTKWYGYAFLTATAVIWGLAFVAQSTSMKYIEPFTFQCSRSFLGMLTVFPMLCLRLAKARRSVRPGADHTADRCPLITGHMWFAGISCGLAFTAACIAQQFAMKSTDAGKAAFITALYIIIVPLIGFFLGERVSAVIWFCVLLCIGGIWLLSVSAESGIKGSDFLLLFCAVMFAVQIRLADHFVKTVDGVWISFVQLLTAFVLTLLPMVLIDRPAPDMIRAAGIPILYAGVMSCGLAYTFQILGQKYTSPITAGLIMSMESVFAMAGGVLLLHQIPTGREIAGCAVVFTAVILSQVLPGRMPGRQREDT